MSLGVRIVAVSLVVTFAVTGPLASIARAQQPAQAAPAPSTPITTPPASSVPQPDLFEEALKKGTPVSPSGPASFQPAPSAVAPASESRGLPYPFYQAMAGFATLFLLPGRLATCVVGTAVGGVILGASLGSGSQWATELAEEGCGGKWVLSGDDLVPGRSPRVLPGTDQP